LTIPIRASYGIIVDLFKVYLSSLVSMPLPVKAITLEWTLVVISSIVLFTFQIFESVRIRCTAFLEELDLELVL